MVKDKILIDCIKCKPDLTDFLKDKDAFDIEIRYLDKENTSDRDPAKMSLSGRTNHIIIRSAK